MLKLKQVSKFYYNKGIITSGFNKINLDLKIGEFVAITGESGSGKSTLLNVLGGLDSYEEGEMFVNNKETSHFSESDFEIYRKKYIGNIFQNFNLVNSYSVYQNVELVLLINGFKKKEVKEKIYNILRQVDLFKFRKTKVSKLSGGQKQRVAIARALAKDTPVILADEPTGNLDTKSAESIIKLLSDISKNKLVIVVTHNYELLDKYVTRKIVMHDGKIIEDKKIKEITEEVLPSENKLKETTILNKLRIGIRNTFNIVPKFALLFLVYFFVILSIASAYSSFKKSEYETSKTGINSFFLDTSDKRIVIKKNNLTPFTDEEYDSILKLDNIERLVKDDISIDSSFGLTDDDVYFYGQGFSLENYTGNIDLGRMPTSDLEAIMVVSKNDWYVKTLKEELFDRTFYFQDYDNFEKTEKNIKIVGIEYIEDENFDYSNNIKFYFSKDLIEKRNKQNYIRNSSISYTLANKKFVSEYSYFEKVMTSEYVPKGSVYIPSDLSYLCKDYNCLNYLLKLEVSNIFYKEELILNVIKTYDKNNFFSLLNLKYEDYNGKIFVNVDDFNNMFNKGFYQSSVYVKSPKEVYKTIDELNKLNINTLYIKDTLFNFEETVAVLKIVKVILLTILFLSLFFITYFIIKLILKSRNVYFSTLRILGSSSKTTNRLLDIELFVVTNISYIFFLLILLAFNINIIKSNYIRDLVTYISIKEYIIIYLIVVIMSYLESRRYSRKLFKNSALKTYKEEV